MRAIMLTYFTLISLSIFKFTTGQELSDADIIKQEMFLQKLSGRISHTLSKRDVTNIQNPPMYSSADNLMHSYIPLEGDRRYGIEEPCGVRNITINFEQIGWMHILAPKVKLGLNGNSIIDSACCSPTSLSPLQLLVQSAPENAKRADYPMSNLEVITVPDMIVNACGCN